ncbi:MAG: DUF2877 domain-containing protein [bacterium]
MERPAAVDGNITRQPVRVVRAGRQAIVALDALGPAGRGRIVSVYRRAVNILLDSGELVGLLAPGTPLHPWAVIVDREWRSVTVEQVVFIEDTTLAGEGWGLSWDGVAGEDLRLLRRARRLAPSVLDRLRGLCPEKPESRFWERIVRILNTSSTGNFTAMIGIGEGLTPAGDDLLVGLLAGLDLLDGVFPRARSLRSDLVAAIPNDLRSITTRQSAQMIEVACRGRYAEPVLQLLEAVCDLSGDTPSENHTAAMGAAVTALLAVGHDSGLALLWGITRGLELSTPAGDHARQT